MCCDCSQEEKRGLPSPAQSLRQVYVGGRKEIQLIASVVHSFPPLVCKAPAPPGPSSAEQVLFEWKFNLFRNPVYSYPGSVLSLLLFCTHPSVCPLLLFAATWLAVEEDLEACNPPPLLLSSLLPLFFHSFSLYLPPQTLLVIPLHLPACMFSSTRRMSSLPPDGESLQERSLLLSECLLVVRRFLRAQAGSQGRCLAAGRSCLALSAQDSF